jgi:hypothetical protein
MAENGNTFADASDTLYSGGYKVDIYHIPSGLSVDFKGWVTAFSDSYQSNWNTEDTYGRMDPISTFQNTTRTISLSWDVVAHSEEEAKSNMKKCEKLFMMLYPSYEGCGDNASSITQAPLFKFKFGNLITAPTVSANASAVEGGLMGTMGGFEYSPDFESGFFTPGTAEMYPQAISLSAEFQVLHNFPVGWNKKSFRSHNFPYGSESDVASCASEAAAEVAAEDTVLADLLAQEEEDARIKAEEERVSAKAKATMLKDFAKWTGAV